MTIQEHINWWRDEALRNWDTAEYNRRGEQFVFALFAFHLSMEKLLKAIWIKDNQVSYPPQLSNLRELYNDTNLYLPDAWYDYLVSINNWNKESRYPDYKLKVYKRANSQYLAEHVKKLYQLKQLFILYIH